MYHNNNNNNSDHSNSDNSSSRRPPPQQQSIDIPSLKHDILYGDLLGYDGSSNFNMQQQTLLEGDDDPMTDHNFLAYLSLFSSSEPTPPPSSSLLLLQGHNPFEQQAPQPEATTSATITSNSSSNKKKQHRLSSATTSRKSSSTLSTKIGQCEHPKHVIYRQEKYTLMPSASADETSVMKTIPRRGRPPKGSKSTEFVFSTSPVENNYVYYPIVELTVRPLPKRLEAVVGKSNIKVCLTCLKRSDTDPEYIRDEAYIGPQQIYKRKEK